MTSRRLPSLGKREIERVRAKLYRSVGDLEQWPDALLEVARTVGATGVVMSMPSLDPRFGYSFDNVAVNVDFDLGVKHAHESGTLDPWSTGALQRGYRKPGFILRGGDMCDRRDVERSSWKSQVVDPAEMGDVLTASLEAPPESRFGVSIAVFHRHRPCEPFEPETVERLRLFTDDLSLSTKVAFSLRGARRRATLLQSALDRISEAIIVLDGTQIVQFHNSAASTFLQSGGILAIRRGRLVALRHGENERLAKAIFEASHSRRGTGISFAREDKSPLTATVAPFEQDPGQAAFGGPSNVIITVSGFQDVAEVDLIRSALSLTAAEARLAQALAENRSLAQAAAAFDVSIETVRTQLKSIFAKLNLSKQAEVAGLVQRIPRSNDVESREE